MSRQERKARRAWERFQEQADSFELVEVSQIKEIEISDATDIDAENDEDADETTREPLKLAPPNLTASKEWRFKLSPAEIDALLKRGKMGELKLVPWGSNYTFIAPLYDPQSDGDYAVIYKPMRGEAPLWDFPSHTLYKREYCAYIVSAALGWHFIPPVVIRDGQHGVGTVQLFVDLDERYSFYDFRERHAHELKRIALFDYLTNNADRKAGHCLLGVDGLVWGIDHGLCFNSDPKLRTIIWDWAGEPIPSDIVQDLDALFNNKACLDELLAQLTPHLDGSEITPFLRRAETLLQRPVFPQFVSRRQVPWGFF
jgi:uncharacterized repeat protein (TIGR03843 family)